MSERTATLLVVGDVHRHWRDADREFLERSDCDLALFVGDLGDEDVELVRDVAAVRARKAVILGNHDAWQSFSTRRPTQKLRDSLSALGQDHLAYGVREVPSAGLSVVGARPFSWGGPSLRSPDVYHELYGVRDMRASADRIYEAARSAQHRDLLVLAHNGPRGLSQQPVDIYGKDFGQRTGGDWGDEDLAVALERICASGWRVPCVVAGHMHDRTLNPRGASRTRFVVRGDTVFVNPAVVPRLRVGAGGVELAHFLRMEWRAGKLLCVEEMWVDVHGEVCETHRPDLGLVG